MKKYLLNHAFIFIFILDRSSFAVFAGHRGIRFEVLNRAFKIFGEPITTTTPPGSHPLPPDCYYVRVGSIALSPTVDLPDYMNSMTYEPIPESATI